MHFFWVYTRMYFFWVYTHMYVCRVDVRELFVYFECAYVCISFECAHMCGCQRAICVFLLSVHTYVFLLSVHTYVCGPCGHQRTIFVSWFFPSAIRVLGDWTQAVRLVAGAFTLWSILTDSMQHILIAEKSENADDKGERGREKTEKQ